MRATGLNHVGISTPDLERAVDFYGALFDARPLMSYAWEAGNAAADAGLGLTDTAATIAILDAGTMYLEFFAFTSPTPIRLDEPPTLFREGITHIALEVDDPDAIAGVVVELGGAAVDRDPSSTSPTRLVRDPDGNLIELRPWGPSDQHAQAYGHVRAVAHAGICTLDADRTAAFYAAMGFVAVDDRTWDLGETSELDASRQVARQGRVVMLDAGNASLELLEYRGTEVLARPSQARIIEYGFNHVCVDADDIAALHAHLMGSGMHVHAPWTPMPGGHSAMGYGIDVQGTPIELIEHRSARSAMWPGALRAAGPLPRD